MTTEELQARRQAYLDAQLAAWEAQVELGKAIKEARETRSLAEIASDLGVSRQRVWQLTQD